MLRNVGARSPRPRTRCQCERNEAVATTDGSGVIASSPLCRPGAPHNDTKDPVVVGCTSFHSPYTPSEVIQ